MLLSQSIKYLKGVGPMRANILEKELQILTIGDLITTYPYRYIDRSKIYAIRELREGMQYVQIKGKILYFEKEGEGRKKRLKAIFSDGAGVMELVWFCSLAYIQKHYKVNTEYIAFGTPQIYGGRWSIAHPELEEAQTALSQGVFAPYYHTTEKLKRSNVNSKTIERLIKAALSELGNTIPESLPPYILKREKLCSRSQAIFAIHMPSSFDQLEKARKRLKFEELFYIQLGLLNYANERQLHSEGQRFVKIGDYFNGFYKYHIPFNLTNAQKRVLHEIRADVGSGKQMNRLLQGDVGSGKTIVALMTMLMALDNGKQVCLMAPTEILAEQHYETIVQLLSGMPINTGLLTSSTKGKLRKKTLESLASGHIGILIGTHAVIEDNVLFSNLGLAVIDEQHRFGVAQRAKLWKKNPTPPHILIMTATPIPRTLAMTVYGDLNVSVLDELPPGRKPVLTRRVEHHERAKLYALLENEIRKGHQVYYVFPLIKENEKMDLRDLENGYESLCKQFPTHEVAYVHGRMGAKDKNLIMSKFADGKVDILVATTVIEVGVNVPNATVMVIEGAQRFGLSQLHQLRGRVGRNADQAYCFLVTPDKLSGATRKRIDIMTATNDGFKIAEEDLQIRGPGDLQGTMQSGIPFNLKIANLVTDGQLLEEARRVAHEVIGADPQHNHSYNDIIWKQLKQQQSPDISWEEIS